MTHVATETKKGQVLPTQTDQNRHQSSAASAERGSQSGPSLRKTAETDRSDSVASDNNYCNVACGDVTRRSVSGSM